MPILSDHNPGLNIMGGGDAGLGGGGILGGLLIGALLGRGGLGGLGGERDRACELPRDCVTTATLEASLGNLQESINSAIVMGKLASIEAAIPTTALETQATINSSIASLALGTQQGFSNVKDSVQASAALNLAATNAAERTTLTSSAALLAAIKDAEYANTIATRDDGDKTRAKIDFYHDQDLQRQLTVAQSALLEERSHGRIREVEVSVNQSVNQTQTNNQQQSQAQQQFQLLAGLVAAVNNLAGDIQAVKQGQVIFNSGTMAASGTQAAANTKVA